MIIGILLEFQLLWFLKILILNMIIGILLECQLFWFLEILIPNMIRNLNLIRLVVVLVSEKIHNFPSSTFSSQVSNKIYFLISKNPFSHDSKYVMHPFWNWVIKVGQLTLNIVNRLMILDLPLNPLNSFSRCGWHRIFSPLVALCSQYSTSKSIKSYDGAGLIPCFYSSILIAFYDYSFEAASKIENYPIPKWVFLVTGINVFVAYTLDGIDGKQARRTGTSTPVGELFDHGLDSYSTLFIMIYVFTLFGSHDFPLIRMQFMTFCVYLNFYVSLHLTFISTRLSALKLFHLRNTQNKKSCSSRTLKSTTQKSCFYLGAMT